MTIFDNVLYFTKGSGSNGVDTVYFVDTTGKACPDGVGVPASGRQASDVAARRTTRRRSRPPGSPATCASCAAFPRAWQELQRSTAFPFGIWFANPRTLYVADEGAGDNAFSPPAGTYAAASASTTAGLQKWVLDPGSNSWQLAYTLQSGLDLGRPYAVSGYPMGDNAATGLPWAPATDGLRNIAAGSIATAPPRSGA